MMQFADTTEQTLWTHTFGAPTPEGNWVQNTFYESELAPDEKNEEGTTLREMTLRNPAGGERLHYLKSWPYEPTQQELQEARPQAYRLLEVIKSRTATL